MSNERAGGDDGFSLFIANERSSARVARTNFAAYLDAFGIEKVCAQDIILAFGEAVANAVEHGSSADGNLSIHVRRVCGSGKFATLKIEIADEGEGFVERPRSPLPDVSGARGFGIYIMRAVMDTVEYLDGGRRVVLSKRLDFGCPSTGSG